MVDRERVLAKLDELDGYLGELRSILPGQFEDYRETEKKRACERLIQISIQSAIDLCGHLVAGLRLGLPGDENDLFDRLARRGVLTVETADVLKRMRVAQSPGARLRSHR